MSMVKDRIEQKLTDAFDPRHLEVVNESGNHNVPDGSETHFKVVIVSDEFEGKRLLARHRHVNETLATNLPGPCTRWRSTPTPLSIGRNASAIPRCHHLAGAATAA